MVMNNSSKVQGKGINGKINQGSSEDEIAMKERRKNCSGYGREKQGSDGPLSPEEVNI